MCYPVSNTDSPSVLAAGSAIPGLSIASGFLQALPWDELSLGSSSSPFFLPNMMANRRKFPDPDVWEQEDVPLGSIDQPPVGPASYLIQSRNGYQRAREILSHSKYTEDNFDNLQQPFDTKTPNKSSEAKKEQKS
uniref:Uncharacterized protein n=1 Tax=Gouania willdenowi TaxID=441366 RepID=A0A8C5N2E7_GOUWI